MSKGTTVLSSLTLATIASYAAAMGEDDTSDCPGCGGRHTRKGDRHAAALYLLDRYEEASEADRLALDAGLQLAGVPEDDRPLAIRHAVANDMINAAQSVVREHGPAGVVAIMACAGAELQGIEAPPDILRYARTYAATAGGLAFLHAGHPAPETDEDTDDADTSWSSAEDHVRLISLAQARARRGPVGEA